MSGNYLYDLQRKNQTCNIINVMQ